MNLLCFFKKRGYSYAAYVKEKIMIVSLFYFLLAILGLGFLIFIHELGHYWMARRVGMRVESFGIGFGKPIFSFDHDGVKWNICWLPFGGYVKIAGMEKENGVEPEMIKDGFFGKSSWDRLKVAVMGPLANIVFAFVVFSLIWLTGGREKNFTNVTNRIGWVDPKSDLFNKGIRPGDIILSYNSEPVHGEKDHYQAAMTSSGLVHITGMRWDESKKTYVPFTCDVRPISSSKSPNPQILNTGVLYPASFLQYSKLLDGSQNPLPKGSPIADSGIQYGDRIIWADGERIFSSNQLSEVLNDGRVLVTIKRNNEILLRRVPRITLGELKLNGEQKEELADWQWEAKLKSTKFSSLYFMPYNLNQQGVVESKLSFIDQDRKRNSFHESEITQQEDSLKEHDQIIAVNGIAVENSPEILYQLQHRQVQLIVDRGAKEGGVLSLEEANKDFDSPLRGPDLLAIEKTIGTHTPIMEKGNLVVLHPVVPKTQAEIFQSKDQMLRYATELEEITKKIQSIDNPEVRALSLKQFEQSQKLLYLGLPLSPDVQVTYNPNPFVLFRQILDEVIDTLTALVRGTLSPKWISGPVGIVQVIHSQWQLGIKEALFWLGAISLNLGLLNLLPLPVLDGGYICLSIFEMITGKRLRSKTIEKIVIPFAILLIGFFIFLTYHDILRLLGMYLK